MRANSTRDPTAKRYKDMVATVKSFRAIFLPNGKLVARIHKIKIQGEGRVLGVVVD